MAASDALRRANKAFLSQALDTSLSAGLRNQPTNTSKTYKKPQRDFLVTETPLPFFPMNSRLTLDRLSAKVADSKTAASSPRARSAPGCRKKSYSEPWPLQRPEHTTAELQGARAGQKGPWRASRCSRRLWSWPLSSNHRALT